MTNISRRVVCTGVGLVCPLGVGAQKSWTSMLQSKVGIRKLKDVHLFEGCNSRVAAYVPQDDIDLQTQMPDHDYISKHMKQLSRASLFAMLAAHEALGDAKLLNSDKQLYEKFRPRCGVAIGQGMVDFEDIHENARLIKGDGLKPGGSRRVSPYFITRALINMSAGNVSIRYKTAGINHCASTACATGAHSIGDAFTWIKSGRADLMVCGSTETPINSLAMCGFERLKALCTRYNDNPEAASRPFDMGRCGFVMGEGAGIMILEDLQHAKQRNADIYGEILGFGMSSDAHHLTAPSPDGKGAITSMKAALNDANLDPSDVTHVNAHATSTPLGDDIECSSIEKLFFPEDDPISRSKLSVTSCKSSLGHLLGAAGSVETILTMLSCQSGILIPSNNLVNPIPTSRIEFVRESGQKWDLARRIALKNSFGFGGTNASLVLSNYME